MGGPIFVGTDGDDILANAEDWSDDILLGKEGADLLTGGDQCDWLDGGDGDDILDGGSDEDFLAGGAGNDILAGGEDDDTYVFNTGDGMDIINDDQYNDQDHLSLGPGISPADLTDIIKAGNDLIVKVGASGDQLTLRNWFGQGCGKLDVTFADGTVWDADYLTSQAREAVNDVVITGTDGNDVLQGSEGNDILYRHTGC